MKSIFMLMLLYRWCIVMEINAALRFVLLLVEDIFPDLLQSSSARIAWQQSSFRIDNGPIFNDGLHFSLLLFRSMRMIVAVHHFLEQGEGERLAQFSNEFAYICDSLTAGFFVSLTTVRRRMEHRFLR